MQHRNFLKITACAIVALAPLFAPSLAQTYPIKPIRLVVPFPPAGATDILGRTLAQKLTEVLGQSVIVDNKPGAGGAIGSDIVAKSVADGYTILIASSSTHSVGPALNSKMPYHPIKDFSPIVHLGDVTSVLVVPMSLPVKSVQELVAMAKAKPGSLNFGSSGIGTVVHLTAEEFKMHAGIDIFHVPYKGTALVLPDLISGQISMLFDNTVSVQPSLRAGKVRPLAVTSLSRTALLPDVPTVAEAGLPGFDSTVYFGLWAPAGTPPAIVQRLNAEVNKLLLTPEVRDQFIKLGLDPAGGSAAQFSQRIASDTEKWRKVVQQAGIKPE